MIKVDSLETLTDLVKLMKEYDLSEIDLSDETETVLLKRGQGGAPIMQAPMMPAAPMPAQAPAAVPAPQAPASGAEAPADDDAGLHAITSPMVGTFYSAADPESPAFVKPGAEVSPDSTVCIVEAMKVFSEIKAECSGVIEKVLVKNAEPVEFGQKLFLVRQK